MIEIEFLIVFNVTSKLKNQIAQVKLNVLAVIRL